MKLTFLVISILIGCEAPTSPVKAQTAPLCKESATPLPDSGITYIGNIVGFPQPYLYRQDKEASLKVVLPTGDTGTIASGPVRLQNGTLLFIGRDSYIYRHRTDGGFQIIMPDKNNVRFYPEKSASLAIRPRKVCQ